MALILVSVYIVESIWSKNTTNMKSPSMIIAKKRNEVKKLAQGQNIESAITTNIWVFMLTQGISLILNFCSFFFFMTYMVIYLQTVPGSQWINPQRQKNYPNQSNYPSKCSKLNKLLNKQKITYIYHFMSKNSKFL